MTSAGTVNNGGVALELSNRIDAVLTPLLPPNVAYALLDFPNHSNVGDSAIWLGEKKWLFDNRRRLIYTCDIDTYSPRVLADQLGDGCILLHGGGGSRRPVA